MTYSDFSRGNIRQALNLPEGWDIEGVKIFGAACGILASIPHALPNAGCPQCKAHLWRGGGREPRLYRSPSVGGRHTQVLVTYSVHRCMGCGVTYRPPLPPGSLTPQLVEQITDFATQNTVADTCRFFALDRDQVVSLTYPLLGQRVEQRVVEPPTYLGIDDTRAAGIDCTLFVDLERGRHIEVLPRFGAEGIESFLKSKRPEWEGTLRCVVIDPYKPFKKQIHQAWPGLPIVLDRYHVVRIVNSSVTAFTQKYKETHRLKGDLRDLRHPERARYSSLAEQLRGTHLILVEVHGYARRLTAVYEATNSQEAREVWLDWVAAMPDALRPFLLRGVKDLDAYWRMEICNAADFQVPAKKDSSQTVVVSNGMTESLHQRVQRIAQNASRMSFDVFRGRVLLADSAEELDEQFRSERADLKRCREGLREQVKCA